MKTKILAFSGSARTDSYNKKLIKIAAAAASREGAEVNLIDLRDYPMPLYEGDLEVSEGVPENALKIREMMLQSQGLLISSPEYNSSISPLLKNTLDWVSRPTKGQAGMFPYNGKVAALMSASPGGLGGLRGLVTVRSILSNMDVLVLPNQVAVVKAHEAFNADGSLKDSKLQGSVENLAANLTKILSQLHQEKGVS